MTPSIRLFLYAVLLLVIAPHIVISARRTMNPAGCYSSPGALVNKGEHVLQSRGRCMRICEGLNSKVMGLTNGTTCYCGEPGSIPPPDTRVRLTECNRRCVGYASETCKWRCCFGVGGKVVVGYVGSNYVVFVADLDVSCRWWEWIMGGVYPRRRGWMRVISVARC